MSDEYREISMPAESLTQGYLLPRVLLLFGKRHHGARPPEIQSLLTGVSDSSELKKTRRNIEDRVGIDTRHNALCAVYALISLKRRVRAAHGRIARLKPSSAHWIFILAGRMEIFLGEWHYVDSEDFEEYLKGVQIIQIHVIVHKWIHNIRIIVYTTPVMSFKCTCKISYKAAIFNFGYLVFLSWTC
jgi:hypothetical protein